MTAGSRSCPDPAGGRLAVLAAALRAGAAGLYCAEAGVELLICQGAWLRRDDFTVPFIAVTPGLAGRAAMAAVGWDDAVAALDGGACRAAAGNGGYFTWRRASPPGYPLTWARRSPAWTVPVSRRRPGPSCTLAGTGTLRSPCRRASRLTCRERANDEVEPAAGRRPPRHLDGE